MRRYTNFSRSIPLYIPLSIPLSTLLALSAGCDVDDEFATEGLRADDDEDTADDEDLDDRGVRVDPIYDDDEAAENAEFVVDVAAAADDVDAYNDEAGDEAYNDEADDEVDNHDGGVDPHAHGLSLTEASPSPVALTLSSFLFQHPLTGGSWNHTCDFNTVNCYVKGQYHTAIDESAGTSTAIRASNFGVRSLRQNMSNSDHGMGNAVAVRYLLDDGSYIYGTDNHMSSHHSLSTRPDGEIAVPRGGKLGNVGGSGYGNPTYWGYHDHHEMKTVNTFSSGCNGTYYGYTPSSALLYCYKSPSDYFGTRRVLMPEFSLANSGWGDYDVLYGVVNTTIYAQVRMVSAPALSSVGVGGRSGWSATVTDFPFATNRPAGSYTVTTSRTFTSSGDYRFFAAVQSNGAWRGGYPVIFTVLPKSSDFIRDNDMGAASFQSGGLGVARFDGYGYGAHAATGNSGAWARWYTQKAGTYRLWVYVGGNGVGSVRFKIYPNGAGTPIYSDPVNLSTAVYGWVQIKVGATTSWSFTSSGYVGLSADAGAANEVYLFDAIKFTAL